MPPPVLLLNQFERTARWMRREGREHDVVLSCRVRLARNLRRYQYPHLASTQDLLQVRKRTLSALDHITAKAPLPLHFLAFEEFTGWELQSLIDRHLTSREHVKEELGRAVAASADGSLALLVNEEDHLRLQSLLPGLQFDEAYRLVNTMDDLLEGHFDGKGGGGFAFDEEFGYLTACPTNAGTGMRASAMLHLPALEISGHLERAKKWASSQNLTLRGTFGEGSKVWGHLHQLSNQQTLGLDEADILLQMENATRELCEMERNERELLPQKFAVETRDRVGRAYGTIRYARTISCREATDCLSLLRLGQELHWMRGMSPQRFNELLVWIRPAYLQVLHGRSIAGSERDTLRATMLRPHIERMRFEKSFTADETGTTTEKQGPEADA